jgi:hypothetical protein
MLGSRPVAPALMAPAATLRTTDLSRFVRRELEAVLCQALSIAVRMSDLSVEEQDEQHNSMLSHT